MGISSPANERVAPVPHAPCPSLLGCCVRGVCGVRGLRRGVGLPAIERTCPYLTPALRLFFSVGFVVFTRVRGGVEHWRVRGGRWSPPPGRKNKHDFFRMAGVSNNGGGSTASLASGSSVPCVGRKPCVPDTKKETGAEVSGTGLARRFSPWLAPCGHAHLFSRRA